MREARPYVLSIGGFDPSGGAGVLSDIKTFEANSVFGFGVCTALTFQSDTEFCGVEWFGFERIKAQLLPILNKYQLEWVKIGLINDLDVLLEVVNFLKLKNPETKIIWDPIVKASAGFVFHNTFDLKKLQQIFRALYLITPNIEEMLCLVSKADPFEGARDLSRMVSIFLKGGHAPRNEAVQDILFVEGAEIIFESAYIQNGAKHGSGCVLSCAILAALSKGAGLRQACFEGREYTRKFLGSSQGFLGTHENS